MFVRDMIESKISPRYGRKNRASMSVVHVHVMIIAIIGMIPMVRVRHNPM